MQTLFTFISAFLCILPIVLKIIIGDISFIDEYFLRVYVIIFTSIFIILTIYNVITFIKKKAPDSIRYLSILSIIALIGFVPDFDHSYYGFLGFLGFLSFMTYHK